MNASGRPNGARTGDVHGGPGLALEGDGDLHHGLILAPREARVQRHLRRREEGRSGEEADDETSDDAEGGRETWEEVVEVVEAEGEKGGMKERRGSE